MQVVNSVHGMPVKPEDQVSIFKPSPVGGTSRIDADDQHAPAMLRSFSATRLALPAAIGMGTVCTAMPMRPRRTRPSRIKRPATNLAVLTAIAKQMPCAGRIMAVLTPITCPRESTSGPPELPGLSAASV